MRVARLLIHNQHVVKSRTACIHGRPRPRPRPRLASWPLCCWLLAWRPPPPRRRKPRAARGAAARVAAEPPASIVGLAQASLTCQHSKGPHASTAASAARSAVAHPPAPQRSSRRQPPPAVAAIIAWTPLLALRDRALSIAGGACAAAKTAAGGDSICARHGARARAAT